MNIVENARQLAFKYHEGQMYGNLPYTSHLEDVVKSLSKKHNSFKRENYVLIATAWLHDILEDTDCTWEELVAACGDTVARAVSDLTKAPTQDYTWYIARVKANPIALEVKLHDTLCNLRASVMGGEKGRIKKYARQLQLLVGE